MNLQNMIAAAMIGMQVRVVDGIQRPAFQHITQQNQRLILMGAIASINDGCFVLANEDNIIRREPTALEYLH
jgi:hypothetical protein